MIRLPTTNVRVLFFCTVILSMTWHILIFCSFTIVFPPRLAEHHPTIAFLGSIFGEQDFVIIKSHRTQLSSLQTGLNSINLRNVKSKTQMGQAPTKPGYSAYLPTEKKLFIKPKLIEETVPQETTTDNLKKQFGINLTAPPRIPLKLYKNDTH